MDYNYLVPANSKKQGLIFGFMEGIDLGIAIGGIILGFIFMMIFPLDKLWGIIIAVFPICTAVFLVFPVANYHNIRKFIREMYQFYFVKRRKYVWRGWCYKYEQRD